MWSFQQHFRAGAQSNADFVFRRLSERIKTDVFLVGLLEQEREGSHVICVEPEDDFWLLPEHLSNIMTAASTRQAVARESQVFHSLPQAQENHANAIRRRAIQEATKNAIETSPNKPQDREYFVGLPVSVDGYQVMVVIGLKSDDLDAYPRLVSDEYWLHEYRSYKIPRSLFESVIDAFLAECSEELCKPNAGEGLLSGSTQHVLEDAAKKMVCGLAMRCDTWQNTLCAEQGVFDCCLKIAAMGYEKASARGKIVLARRDHPAIQTRISFRNPVNLNSSRGVRKLLEMTRNNLLYLHTNSTVVWGLVGLDAARLDENDESLFEIEFIDSYLWECRIQKRVLLQVQNGVPRLSGRTVDRITLQNDLLRLFPQIDVALAQRYLDLIEAASTQEHGTMVVISADAKTEAERLANQSTPIDASTLDPKLAVAVSGIDGAILLGTDGKCYALGVILDGIANEFGDPARGARYNSALRYVHWQLKARTACMAFIVSEDGGVDVVPKLRPRICRRIIDDALRELENIEQSDQVPRRYSELVNWFDGNRFYLRQEDCGIVNRVFNTVETRIVEGQETWVRMERKKWDVNPEMREDWYYE